MSRAQVFDFGNLTANLQNAVISNERPNDPHHPPSGAGKTPSLTRARAAS